MYGWAGSILDIDLSSGRIAKRPFEEGMGRLYLGGRGINSRILFDEVKAGTKLLSSENILIFGTGPLGGTLVPSANRMSVTAKSPMYDGVGTSNVGGSFGPELKYAGYDHIIIRGKANEPVYVWIDDDFVELRAAGHLWGKSTWEADHIIRAELGDPEIKVAAIGPAGEKLVKYACIMFTKYRAAGQTGMGAVMGSKNLKAVAARGTKSLKVAKPDLLIRLIQEITQRIKANKNYSIFSVHGTPSTIGVENEIGYLGIRNYQQSGNWEGVENLVPEAIFPFYTRDKACHGCPLHCSHFFEVKEGPYKGEKGGGIEAGLTYSFGAMLANADTASMFKCLNLSNQYGIDILELPTTLAAAMEWYEKGVITKKDTDGIALEWGNTDAIIEMIHKVGKREGIGDLLAEGAIHAARKIGKGAEEYVTHCKGMVVGCNDIRITKGMALNHVSGTVPAHHEEGAPLLMSPKRAKAMFGTEDASDPTSYKTANVTIYYQNLCTIMDAIELCKFISGWVNQEVNLKESADLFSAATGVETDKGLLELAAERIHDLERAFAVRDGMTREGDHIYGKLMKEPTPSGRYKGEVIDPVKFEAMLDEYYELRGWDKATGIPTRAKLEKVGLNDVADELAGMGKLPSEGKQRVKGKEKR